MSNYSNSAYLDHDSLFNYWVFFPTMCSFDQCRSNIYIIVTIPLLVENRYLGVLKHTPWRWKDGSLLVFCFKYVQFVCFSLSDCCSRTEHPKYVANNTSTQMALRKKKVSESPDTWTRMHIILRHFHDVFLNTLHAHPQSDKHSVSCTWTRE